MIAIFRRRGETGIRELFLVHLPFTHHSRTLTILRVHELTYVTLPRSRTVRRQTKASPRNRFRIAIVAIIRFRALHKVFDARETAPIDVPSMIQSRTTGISDLLKTMTMTRDKSTAPESKDVFHVTTMVTKRTARPATSRYEDQREPPLGAVEQVQRALGSV